VSCTVSAHSQAPHLQKAGAVSVDKRRPFGSGFRARGGTMTDPSDLMRRAAELTDRADHEESIEIRDRLLRMAAYYVQIAESEEWLSAHQTSRGSMTGPSKP